MTATFRTFVLASLAFFGAERASVRAQSQPPRAGHVIVVTIDGLRWQEVFRGAARELIGRQTGGVADTAAVLQRFWRETPESRREALMPFLWGVIARQGRLLGDSASGSMVRVTNGLWFSYPGYSELLTGAPDDRINSNDQIPNPNVTVLEWLNGRPGFAGRVAAYGSWDVLPYIVNAARSGIHTNGDGPPFAPPSTEVERALNDLAADLPPYWGTVRFDAVTMQGALQHLKTRKPRVLYVMLGDTDEWAHERRYDLYLDAVWRSDRFLRTLWETAQSMPEYRGRTALLVTTDHGRGSASDWTDHGRNVPAAARIWVGGLGAAVTGDRLPVTGDPLPVTGHVSYMQSQFAATIAAVLGLDGAFRAANPRAAPPLSWP
jgi:hypothetical protein